MKKFKLSHKILAIVMAILFVFQLLNNVNSHTYTIGVDSYHYYCGCFGCAPTHLAVTCNARKYHL